MGEHIPKARLLAVAVDDELIFTLEEFNHLKACQECFVAWTEFICQSQLRDEEKKKTNQAIGIVLEFQSRKLVHQRNVKLNH
jgi:EAL domain-containing protein (putative c-di-GMP-specific phosphodiesterase class I)